LGKALADPAVQGGLRKMAVTPGGPTGEAFRQRMETDIKTFTEVVKTAHLTFQ
jgi:tripartite-type tricarboxylate transporter receptor subunit TctC